MFIYFTQALHYCEVIAGALLQRPGQYSLLLARLVYDLANQLKFADPQRLQGSEDMGDPWWITQLQQLVKAYEVGVCVCVCLYLYVGRVWGELKFHTTRC